MKKTIKKIGLCVIACSMIACCIGCAGIQDPSIGNGTPTEDVNGDNGGSSGNSGSESGTENGSGSGSGNGTETGTGTGTGSGSEQENPPTKDFKAGWYYYKINDSYVYVQYNENKDVTKILTVEKELLGDDFNTEKSKYDFDSINVEGNFITDIKSLPPYYFKAITTISVKLDNGNYKGLSASSEFKPSIKNGILTYGAITGGSLSFSPKYYDTNGNEAMTSNVPSMSCTFTNVTGNGVDFKKHFIITLDENNNYVIKYNNKVSETTVFDVELFDKVHGTVGSEVAEDKKITLRIEALPL